MSSTSSLPLLSAIEKMEKEEETWIQFVHLDLHNNNVAALIDLTDKPSEDEEGDNENNIDKNGIKEEEEEEKKNGTKNCF